MAERGIKIEAAISRIAARIAPLVTNGIIDGVASQCGVRHLVGSNKVDKVFYMLSAILSDGRARRVSSDAIVSLALEAHHRAIKGATEMTWEDLDAIVTEMRTLGLDAGELANTGWRKGLKRKATETPLNSDTRRVAAPGVTPAMPSPAETSLSRPREYALALDYLRRLLADGTDPQWRGRELEKLVLEVLAAEKLSPEHNLVNPGEQIDHAFVLDGQHYLVECKWEHERIGLPVLTAFSTKVARKAVGTFGVLISMSGFATNINDTAPVGAPLNCVGIVHQQFVSVLEGRTTFGGLVRNARAAASRRSLFHAIT